MATEATDMSDVTGTVDATGSAVATERVEGARCFRAMVPMRDGARMNTFVYLPESGGPTYPVILHRTPYGITSPEGEAITDPTRGWLPDPATPLLGPILRGWKDITSHGYAAVYQDCRGRYGSEGEDHVYGDDAPDGYDTLEWIAGQPWSNQRVGLSGASAAATTALAAASACHPSVKAFFTQVGGSSIYDDVVYEGNSIEMERLWLWVSNNIPGLSASHREAVMRRTGLDADQLEGIARSARQRYKALDGARHGRPPYLDCEEWLHLPLSGYPDFAVWQPYLDEILRHPAPDAFRAAHNFRATIDVPGFHVTSWYDIFLTSVIAAFQEIQARVGDQRLWIGPNAHYFVYETQFWTRDPYFEWFDHWLGGRPTPIIDEPPVYYSPRAWVADTAAYVPDDWRHAETWPPPGVAQLGVHLRGDGSIGGTTGRRRPLVRLRPQPADPVARRPQHDDHGRCPRPAVGAGARGLRARLRRRATAGRPGAGRAGLGHRARRVRLSRHRRDREADRPASRRAGGAADGRGDAGDVPPRRPRAPTPHTRRGRRGDRRPGRHPPHGRGRAPPGGGRHLQQLPPPGPQHEQRQPDPGRRRPRGRPGRHQHRPPRRRPPVLAPPDHPAARGGGGRVTGRPEPAETEVRIP